MVGDLGRWQAYNLILHSQYLGYTAYGTDESEVAVSDRERAKRALRSGQGLATSDQEYHRLIA